MTGRAPRAAQWTIAGALSCAACTSTPTPSPAPSPSASSTASASSASSARARIGWEGAWGRFHSRRHGAWLQLPDGAAWRIDDHKASWLVARHPATSTVLRFKLFREEHAVNRDRCEAMMRRDDPTLPREDDAAIDRADAPVAGWDSRAFAVVSASRDADAPLVGQYVAWGASIRRCFALHVATSARGADAAATLGARLAELPELTKRLSFEDTTAGPGRAPVSP